MISGEIKVWWREGDERVLESEADLAAAISEAESEELTPIVVSVQAPLGVLTFVVGDAEGSSLVYFPPDYSETGVGSMSSVADPQGRDADAWEPPQVAYLTGHYSELPRWMVVPNERARAIVREFMESSGQLPTSIEWQRD